MPKKQKLTLGEYVLNKSILTAVLFVLGIFTIVGYATNVLVGVVFMILFGAVFAIFIDLSSIEEWIDSHINKRQW